ncbi:MAG: T9SS type A sorting domain-containing protein [Candidatus Marinimicrobia bacterium]|nr:T9SS type A sorting domain-containing protein [Candidatus Neomarinimicrobiota bacterium]
MVKELEILKSNSNLLLFVSTLIISCSLSAHVRLDYPSGDEEFFVGDTVVVQWTRLANHAQNNWDLFYSPDNGNSWTPLALNLPVSQFDYEWIVSQEPNDHARIRIFMDNPGNSYNYYSSDFQILAAAVSLGDIPAAPNEHQLLQNYPNPFNPTTNISYSVGTQTHIKLTVMDIQGVELITLRDEISPPASYNVTWDGRDRTGERVSTGVYFCRLSAGQFSQTIKMVWLK